VNSYDQFLEIRERIGEATAVHWTDLGILRKMNSVQRTLFMRVSEESGDWFMSSTGLTPVASVVTLPSDCAKPIYMEETANPGREVPIRGTVRERGLTRLAGTSLYDGAVEAYPSGGTLEVNMDSYTEPVTLWYLKRLVDMAFGTAAAGTTGTRLDLQLTMGPRYEDDYYNDVTVELQDSTGIPKLITTVSDYAASGAVVTLADTGAVAAYLYGTVSQLPEECHELLIQEVTVGCLMKPGSIIDPAWINYNRALLKELRADWTDWLGQRVLNSRHVRTTEIE